MTHGEEQPDQLTSTLENVSSARAGDETSQSTNTVEGSGDGAWAGTERATGGGWLMMI